MSAPPIGSVIVTPSKSASTNNAVTTGARRRRARRPAPPATSVPASTTMLTKFWPRKRKLRLMSPWSLPNAIKLPENDTAPMMPPSTPSMSTAGAVRLAREQLDGGDGAGGAAAHAVVERDHLRHVRHRDAPAVTQAAMPPTAIATVISA